MKKLSWNDIVGPILINVLFLYGFLGYYLVHNTPLNLWDKILGFVTLAWGVVILPLLIGFKKNIDIS